jgi:hypothetical protein
MGREKSKKTQNFYKFIVKVKSKGRDYFEEITRATSADNAKRTDTATVI